MIKWVFTFLMLAAFAAIIGFSSISPTIATTTQFLGLAIFAKVILSVIIIGTMLTIAYKALDGDNSSHSIR